MIVVTNVAMFEASLTILSISESNSPSVSSDTMVLMSSAYSSNAGYKYCRVLSFEIQWVILLLRSRESMRLVTALEEWVAAFLRSSTDMLRLLVYQC